MFPHNFTFLETKFPHQSDFNDLPISAFSIHNPASILESDESSESEQAHEQVIHEQIIIQSSLIDYIFAVYDSLVDNTPLSFKDVMSRADYKLWWQAMVDEIKAVIQNKTWELMDLPLNKRAIPLK